MYCMPSHMSIKILSFEQTPMPAQTKWCDVYYNAFSMPSGLEVHTTDRKQSPNHGSVSVMLQ